MIRKHLKLPVDGHLVEDMRGLTKQKHEFLFEGDFPRNVRGCKLDAAKPQWKQWFKFVNDYMMFRPQKYTMTQKMIVTTMMTWDGKKVNWAQAVQQ